MRKTGVSGRRSGARGRRGGSAGAPVIADQLHSAAIHLLRWLRNEDAAAGLSAPRLSALSVVAVAGPITLGDLAAAEGVRAPTMTRLVSALEREGLVRRVPDATDRRITHVRATRRGRALLTVARRRRVAVLARSIAAVGAGDRARLARAAALLEQFAAAGRPPRS